MRRVSRPILFAARSGRVAKPSDGKPSRSVSSITGRSRRRTLKPAAWGSPFPSINFPTCSNDASPIGIESPRKLPDAPADWQFTKFRPAGVFKRAVAVKRGSSSPGQFVLRHVVPLVSIGERRNCRRKRSEPRGSWIEPRGRIRFRTKLNSFSSRRRLGPRRSRTSSSGRPSCCCCRRSGRIVEVGRRPIGRVACHAAVAVALADVSDGLCDVGQFVTTESRTLLRPTMTPSTKIVATSMTSAENDAPASSFHKRAKTVS